MSSNDSSSSFVEHQSSSVVTTSPTKTFTKARRTKEKALNASETEALAVNSHYAAAPLSSVDMVESNGESDNFSVSLRVFQDNHQQQQPTTNSCTSSSRGEPNKEGQFCTELAQIRDSIEYLRMDLQHRNINERLRGEWKQVVAVLDRCLLIFFFLFTVVTTTVLMVKVLVDSKAEFEREVVHTHEGEVDLSKLGEQSG